LLQFLILEKGGLAAILECTFFVLVGFH